MTSGCAARGKASMCPGVSRSRMRSHALLQDEVSVRGHCVEELDQLLESGLRGPLFITGVGVARAGTQAFGYLLQGQTAARSLTP